VVFETSSISRSDTSPEFTDQSIAFKRSGHAEATNT